MDRFLAALSQGPLVADGGMGSMIHQLADAAFRVPDEVNLRAPDVVLGIHVRFLHAGAQVIETNTFASNAIRLEEFGLADQVAHLNGRGVKLAREAREIVGRDAFIAGSIGPTGLRRTGDPTQDTLISRAFSEQARALDDRGVDLFVLETFMDPDELAMAAQAVRTISSLPVVAQLAVPARDSWSDDDDLDEALVSQVLHKLTQVDADVLGLNCSLGPAQLLPYLHRLHALAPDRLLAFQPNSGLPRRQGGRFLYPSASTAWWTEVTRQARASGARLIGGCCGTGPEQIEAIARGVSLPIGDAPHRDTRPASASIPAGGVHPVAPASNLAAKLERGDFVVSIQVDPPKGTSTEMVLEAVRAFRDTGLVDVVDVNSNPMARLHMDALWMSSLVEQEGMETIAHYTPRDASLMGIQGNLLGAWTQGVRNVLVITGDPSVVAGEPGGTDVYQTDAIGMVQSLAELNRGLDTFGNRIGNPPNFTIGVAVNPNHEDLDHEIDRFRRKIDAGAQFAMTQVFFEWSCWERFLDRMGGRCPIPVLAAVWPLTSHRLALRLHNEVPGIIVPDELLAELENAGSEARAVGFEHARKMLREARERVSGVYIIAPFKRPVNALELFEPAKTEAC